MSTNDAIGSPDAPSEVAPARRGAWSLIRALGWPGATLALFVVIALIGPLIAPSDPLEIHVLDVNAPPLTDGFPLGTDGVGRDQLSRVLWGARLTMMIGLVPVATATVISLVLSLLAVFGPTSLGFGVMRTMDVFLAFPGVMLALAVAAMLGPSVRNAILALTIILIPLITRVSRAAALDVARQPYVAAARVAGASPVQVTRDIVLPNMLAPVLAYVAALGGLVIIAGAGLSFLGVGVQPPTAEWGRMVADGRDTFLINPWPSLIPGACIFLVCLSLNLAADRLRDYLDPRMR